MVLIQRILVGFEALLERSMFLTSMNDMFLVQLSSIVSPPDYQEQERYVSHQRRELSRRKYTQAPVTGLCSKS